MAVEKWFSYGSIRYTIEQILFLLAHKDLLESGRWVPEHKETGYTGSSKGRAYNDEGYFVKPVIIMAELMLRLDACNLDGELVVERYTNGYDEMDIADRHKLDYWGVIYRINSALNYCRGANRKRTNYWNYKAGRSSYIKKRGLSHHA